MLPSLCLKSCMSTEVLDTLGRAARIAKIIETRVPIKNSEVGTISQGLESNLGATEAMMMDMIIPLKI